MKFPFEVLLLLLLLLLLLFCLLFWQTNTSPAALHPVAGPWASGIVSRLFARMQDVYCFYSPNRTEVKMGQNKKALSIVCCILGIVLWFYGATASSRMFCQLSPSLSLPLSLSISLSLSIFLLLSVHYVIDFIAHNAVAASLATMRGLMTQRGPSLLLLLCPLLLLCSASARHWPVLRAAAVPAHLPPGGFI